MTSQPVQYTYCSISHEVKATDNGICSINIIRSIEYDKRNIFFSNVMRKIRQGD